MTPSERRYLFVQTPIASGVVNAIVNGAIGWGITRGLAEFPVWRLPGVAFDLVATVFGVALGTCVGSAVQAHLDLRAGRIAVPRDLPPRLERAVRRLPRGALRRGFVVGIAVTLLLCPFLLLGLGIAGEGGLPVPTFVGLKALLSGAEGALVSPLLVLCALREARPEP